MKILITGAGGFLGSHAAAALAARGHSLRAVSRSRRLGLAEEIAIEDLSLVTDFRPLVEGVDAVVHLAANVHRTRRRDARDADRFDAVNRAATRRLAVAAREAGIERFLFMSSIAVHGRGSDVPLRADDVCAPVNLYGRSKLAAEEEVRDVYRSGLVVIRPPLAYGPGVPAKFLGLMKAIERGVPLPFGSADVPRQYVDVATLTEVMCRLLDQGSEGTYLVADPWPITMRDLVRELARLMGRRARLLPFPSIARKVVAAIGMGGFLEPVFQPLLIDTEPTWRAVEWRPAGEGPDFGPTVEWFLAAG